MAIVLKNTFVHVEVSHCLRRTKSCDLANLADWCASDKTMLRKNLSSALSSVSTMYDSEYTVDECSTPMNKSKVTVVFRNVPAAISPQRFVNVLLNAGFLACFDAVHVDMSRQTFKAKGLAFVRFLDADFAQQAIDHFTGLNLDSNSTSSKELEVEMTESSNLEWEEFLATADSNARCPPELYPMFFDATTGEQVAPSSEQYTAKY